MDQLASVLLGGALAIVGGAIGQILSHQYGRHREREKVLREKAERALTLSYAWREWMSDLRHTLWATDKEFEKLDPAPELYGLLDLYFPQCNSFLGPILDTQGPLSDFIYEEAQKRLNNKNAWLSNGHDERRQRLSELYMAFGKSLSRLQLAIVADVERQLALERPLLSRIGNRLGMDKWLTASK